ncbi:MAG: ABC transporter substrate-binding protein [Alphaproteobacteria bacterium]
MPLMRRAFFALLVLAAAPLVMSRPAAAAANPAEAFVDDNIQKGLNILKDKKLSTVQRRDQFESLLFSLVDLRRVALFTLGKYRRTFSPADTDAFIGAYRGYAGAAYQLYFAKYTDQTLKMMGSTQNSPTDYTVHTLLVDPGSGKAPAKVDFRVYTDSGKPLLMDVGYENIWLSQTQREQFVSVLDQNGGNMRALITALSDMAANLGKTIN